MMALVALGAALLPKLLPDRLTLLEVVNVVASAAMAWRSCPGNGGKVLAKAVGGEGDTRSWVGSAPACWCLSAAFMCVLLQVDGQCAWLCALVGWLCLCTLDKARCLSGDHKQSAV